MFKHWRPYLRFKTSYHVPLTRNPWLNHVFNCSISNTIHTSSSSLSMALTTIGMHIFLSSTLPSMSITTIIFHSNRFSGPSFPADVFRIDSTLSVWKPSHIRQRHLVRLSSNAECPFRWAPAVATQRFHQRHKRPFKTPSLNTEKLATGDKRPQFDFRNMHIIYAK